MLLENKTGIILGVANKRSIAWHVAKAADQAGAKLVLTYQNDRMKKGLMGLIGELEREPILLPLDVTNEEEQDALMAAVKEQCGGVDFLVHAVAYARREELEGQFAATSADGFREAMAVSTHSFVGLAQRVRPLMEGRNGSLITMSYLGAEKVVPNYNVMGVAKAALEASVRYLASDLGPEGHRVNAVSAGPIKTLAASGISGFSGILDVVASKSPLRRNVEGADVGKASLFLLSELASGVTGEVLHVDCGFNIMGIA